MKDVASGRYVEENQQMFVFNINDNNLHAKLD